MSESTDVFTLFLECVNNDQPKGAILFLEQLFPHLNVEQRHCIRTQLRTWEQNLVHPLQKIQAIILNPQGSEIGWALHQYRLRNDFEYLLQCI